MSKHWVENYDWTKHQNRMYGPGLDVDRSRDQKLDPYRVYFVEVCSFTFEFHSLDQLRSCLDYYMQKVHPSTRIPGKDLGSYSGDHWETQRWYEKLPMKLLNNHCRPKVVKALERALSDFMT
jgi:hypothetical protein